MDFEGALENMLRETGVDKESAIEIYCLFFDGLPANMKELERNLETRNFTQLAEKAHKLKGAAASLRFEELASHIKLLEAAAKDLNLSESQSAFIKLKELVERDGYKNFNCRR